MLALGTHAHGAEHATLTPINQHHMLLTGSIPSVAHVRNEMPCGPCSKQMSVATVPCAQQEHSNNEHATPIPNCREANMCEPTGGKAGTMSKVREVWAVAELSNSGCAGMHKICCANGLIGSNAVLTILRAGPTTAWRRAHGCRNATEQRLQVTNNKRDERFCRQTFREGLEAQNGKMGEHRTAIAYDCPSAPSREPRPATMRGVLG